MQTLCEDGFRQQLYRKIEGAFLKSQNERNLNCIVTFQTHTILQRFMLRFDQLQLDCNDHLFIYDGAHIVDSYKVSRDVRSGNLPRNRRGPFPRIVQKQI
ncbi:UNVERIFIED_CONTAM: hypothetical protein PYX00_006827 [Menopon gallinae]|uniref:Uncharacterized protein n=1 Tax=Menopon gallinae TaxID=328185 RepID=A0AAW2HXG8_9NEOP